MDRSNSPEEKSPSIPTFVLAHDDEPGPPTELVATKESVDEIANANQQPESPCHKVWAQHNPRSDAEAAQSDEKDVYLDVSEVEAIMSKPDHKITVRILRRILSIMMVILYKTDMEIANKRKMKSLWDRRPFDWPAHVPFKDPNNGVKLSNGKHGQKPVHKELLQMYQFLKKKYQREVRILTTTDSGSGLQAFTEIKEEPASPITPKLEPVTSLPDQTGLVALRDENVSPADIAPQVIAPDGMAVRVEYVAAAAAPPSPDMGRLHHVLEAQYQRLVEHFNQVQNLVSAYNPSALEDFERMGKELEILLDETRNQPERFSLIFNDVGHQVESFLSKVQLLHISYVTNPHFAKECQALTADIKKRTAAALNVPMYQSMQVGMVLANPPPTMAAKQAETPSGGFMSVVRPRLTQSTTPVPQDSKKIPRSAQTITKEDLAKGISALDGLTGAMEMRTLLEPLDIIKERHMLMDQDETNVKMVEESCEKDQAAPTHEELLDDVLGLEMTYGNCDVPWSPASSTMTELASPDTPRYVPDDPVIVSIHQRSPYPQCIPDAMVVTPNPQLNGEDIFARENWREDTNETYLTLPNPEPNPAPNPEQIPSPQEVPLTVVSMEMDHEEDHFDLTHQGMVEEV